MSPFPLGILGSAHVPAAGGWSPLDLPALTGWYDASDSGTITESSGLVSGWNDKSGNGYHLAASGGARPTTGTLTINSLNVLDFSGSNFIFRNSVSQSQPITVSVVLQSDNATPASNALVSNNGPISLGIRGFGIRDWYAANGTNFVSGTDADTSPHLLTVIANGASTVIRLDGTALATGDAGTNASNVIAIGGSNGAGFWDGRVGEHLVVPGALSGSDLTDLEDYLMTKWGL